MDEAAFDNDVSLLGIGLGTEVTLLDLLNDHLIRSPKARNKHIASQSTSRPARKFLSKRKREREQGQEEEDSEKMIGLLYCPSLLDRTVELVSKRLSELVLSEAKSSHVVFMAYISPKLTPSFCSPELFSEHDTRDYCNTVFVRPSLATIQVVETGGIPSRFRSTDSNTDLYVTSGLKKKGSPIADSLLIQGPYKEMNREATALNNMTPEAKAQEHFEVASEVEDEPDDNESDEEDPGEDQSDEDEDYEDEDDEEEASEQEPNDALFDITPDVLMTMEMKTSTALTDSDFSDVVRLKALDRFHDTYIMRFDWPKEKGSTISKSSKMIAQVRFFCFKFNATF